MVMRLLRIDTQGNKQVFVSIRALLVFTITTTILFVLEDLQAEKLEKEKASYAAKISTTNYMFMGDFNYGIVVIVILM
jgi:hypothetical protein